MNRESLSQLRLDRRLMRRKGWIGSKELEQAIVELPDVESKATTLGAEDDAEGGPADETPPVPGA